jgi:hypothetical protein
LLSILKAWQICVVWTSCKQTVVDCRFSQERVCRLTN